MDKYEFNIKVEQIKKLVNKGDYETAMKIADTIDWRRVRSTSLLTMVAQVYERNEEYQDAKDILLLAFERAPLGKGLLFKLTDLALREGNVPEAEDYYREFCDLAEDDPRQNLLRYLILEAKDAPAEQKINSLEKYCEDELDEKWMYHLAELYQQAGREDDCVRICDKIMLLFGLGKYVDKAMELKLQFAPLTKYQMDLVENREKYEAKLRAVEEEYRNPAYHRPVPEEGYLDGDEEAEEKEEPAGAPEVEEDVVASIHEAEAKEELAREMSKIDLYEEEDTSVGGETRVIGDIRELQAAAESAAEEETAAAAPESEPQEETIVEDWDLETEAEETGSNHLMIEAEDSAAGLELALESLKKIHRELGTKPTVAKISGEKLSRKGIFSVADRLSGKDLVVEHASDLEPAAVEELQELMTKDETGIIVVLIDTPARMEMMHRAYPALAELFQYIGCERQPKEDPAAAAAREEKERLEAEQEAEEAKKRLAEREEEIRRQAARDAEEARRLQAEQEEAVRQEEERRQEEVRRLEEERRLEDERIREEQRRQAEYEAAEEKRLEEERRAEIMRQEEEEHRERMAYEEKDARMEEQYQADTAPESGEAAAGADEDWEMDVEEFAKYACQYASEIDCSISGKSMLALYERAEMMEEDGIPLTRANAEDLIEEAADKAEKKSFGSLFSSPYDKDGLLILKEKHFFD